MTLRQALGTNARRIHELVDQLLDSEDGLIVLADGQRTITYAEGFALSPCQLELMTNDVERVVRTMSEGNGVAGPAAAATSDRD
jgi:hypothetical protein